MTTPHEHKPEWCPDDVWDVARSLTEDWTTQDHHSGFCHAVARAILAERERRGWQPIETVPAGDHSAVIDMWAAGQRYTDCRWAAPTYGGEKGVYGWVYEAGYDCDGPVDEWVPDATHWMPPPAPPPQRAGRLSHA